MIALDRRTHVPLQRQVYAAIRSAILEGRLPPGTRLPASRTLADDLGVSRTTVVLAYAHLETEGFIAGRGSAGSFVSILALEKAEPRTVTRPPRDAVVADGVARPRTAGAVALGRGRGCRTCGDRRA